jgi:transposase-like protein
MFMYDVEKLFNEDVREKKKPARNAAARASRSKGFKGSVRTPYDFMSPKERREYAGNSPVITYNLYDKEGGNTEVLNMTSDERREYVRKRIEEGMSKNAIAKEMGVSTYYINKWLGTTTKKGKSFTLSMEGEFEGDDAAARLLGIVETIQPNVLYSLSLMLKEVTATSESDEDSEECVNS